MKSNYDGLLFDMDGVLVDVTKSYRKAIQQTASYFLNRVVSMREVSKIKQRVGMNNDWDATYKLINNSTISYEDVKKVFQSIYWREGNIGGLINRETLLISKEQLIKLKITYKKLGIVTGRPKLEAQFVMERFNLGEIFDILIAKEDTKREKPFPDPIIRAIDLLKLKNTVYIGDSPSDVVAATAAKIPCIYVGKQNMGTIRFEEISQVINYLL